MKSLWYSKTKKRIHQLSNFENCNSLLPFSLKIEAQHFECLLPQGVQHLRVQSKGEILLNQDQHVLQNFFHWKPLFIHEELNCKMNTFYKEIFYGKLILKRFVFFKRKLQFSYFFFSSKIFKFSSLNSFSGKINIQIFQKIWMYPFINSIHEELKGRQFVVSKYLNKWSDSISDRFLFLVNNYWVNSYLYTSFLFKHSQMEQVKKGYEINQLFTEFRLLRHFLFEIYYLIFNSEESSRKFLLPLAEATAECPLPVVDLSTKRNAISNEAKSLEGPLVEATTAERPLPVVNRSTKRNAVSNEEKSFENQFSISFLNWKSFFQHFFFYCFFVLNDIEFQAKTFLFNLVDPIEHIRTLRPIFNHKNYWSSTLSNCLLPNDNYFVAFPLFWQLCSGFKTKQKLNTLLIQMQVFNSAFQLETLKTCKRNSLDEISELFLMNQLNTQIQRHLVLKKKNFLLFVDLYKNSTPYQILNIENYYSFSVLKEIFYFHPVSSVLQEYAKLFKELYRDLDIRDFSNSLIFFPTKWKSNWIYSLSNNFVIWHQIRSSNNFSNKEMFFPLPVAASIKGESAESLLPFKETKSQGLLRIQTSTSNPWFSFNLEDVSISKFSFQIFDVRSLFFKQKKFVYYFCRSNVNFLGHLFCGPSEWSVRTHLKKLKQIFQKLSASPQLELIRFLGPRVRLWSNYYKLTAPKKIFKYCDSILFQFLWKWAIRRHSNKSKNWIKNKYFHQIKNQNWIFAALVRNPVTRFVQENRLLNFGDLMFNKGSVCVIQIPLHNKKKRIVDIHRFKLFNVGNTNY